MSLKTGKKYIVTNVNNDEMLKEGILTASSPETVSIEGKTFDKDSIKIQEKK